MGTSFKGIIGSVAAVALAMMPLHAGAAEVTWTGGAATANWNQAANWSTNKVPANADTVVFAAVGSIHQPVFANNDTVGRVLFTGTEAWTITGGATLNIGSGGIDSTAAGAHTISARTTLNADQIWTIDSGSLTMSGTIGGAGGNSLTKDGAGLLVLAGTNNSFSGSITFAGGIVSASVLAAGGDNSSIGQSGTAAAGLVFNGGTLRYTGTTGGTNRNFTLGTGGGTIEANGTGAVTFSSTAQIAYGGTGARVLTLSGTSTAANTLAAIIGTGTGGATSLIKDGSGTWVLSGSSSFAGGTTVQEGTLQFSAANRLSTTGAITLKGGTLNFNGFGQTTTGDVIMDGGTVSNGTLTKTSGTFDVRSGTASAILAGSAGLTKTTSGTTILSASNTYTGATKVSAGKLLVNGSIASSSGVEVSAGATLGGSGTVSKISGAGTVGPGNSPGIMTTTSVDGTDGLDFTFEFSQAAVGGLSQPTFSNASASGNDLLRLTGATPFNVALTSDNVVTIDFTGLTLNLWDIYQGGFYADSGDFLSSITNATFNYIGLGGDLQIALSTTQVPANFAGGSSNGYITEFTVVPEPTTTALFGFFIGVLLIAVRRKKNVKAAA